MTAMSLSKSRFVVSLFALVGCLGAIPASGQVSRELELVAARALEPPRTLAEPDDAAAGSPSVALRPDGGMVTVWRDGQGRVVGRWLGPAAGDAPPAGDRFGLAGPDSAGGAVVLAGKGARDLYLAVWQGPSLEHALWGRRFDGEGVPLAPAFPLAPSSTGSIDVTVDADGFLAAWWEEIDGIDTLRLRRIGFEGGLEAPFTATEAPATARVFSARVAVRFDGGNVVSWSAAFPDDHLSGVWARPFAAAGAPAGHAVEVDLADGMPQHLTHDLVVLGDSAEHAAALVVWAKTTTDFVDTVSARSLSPTGAAGPVHVLRTIDRDASFERLQDSAVAAADGRAVAIWSELGGDAQRLRALLLHPDGAPRGAPFTVDTWDDPRTFTIGVDAARDASDRLAFAWGLANFIPGIAPQDEPFTTARARRFLDTRAQCGPVYTTELHAEPEAPTDEDPLRLVFEGLSDCVDLSLIDWTVEGPPTTVPTTPVHVRVSATPVPVPGCSGLEPIGFSLPVDVGMLPAGEHQVTLETGLLPNDGVCVWPFDLEVAPGGSPPPPLPPHPDAAPLVSEELPGFRIWVVIAADGEPVLGTKEAECVEETLCVSGRLPGRSEVFVRIPGPRPNGRLWPTVVKLTTSKVEVWIEQVSTGEIEYYVLDEARPGIDELPGLFDREGFPP